jgi:hypothetical protein
MIVGQPSGRRLAQLEALPRPKGSSLVLVMKEFSGIERKKLPPLPQAIFAVCMVNRALMEVLKRLVFRRLWHGNTYRNATK